MLRPTIAPDKPQKRQITYGTKRGANSITTTTSYLLLQAVKDRNKDLEAEHAKCLDELLADFLRCGHGRLPYEGIADFLERRNRIDSLRNEYTRNIREASGGMWFAEADLDGVLEQDRSRFRDAAIAAQREETTRDSDDCFVKLTYSDFSAVTFRLLSP